MPSERRRSLISSTPRPAVREVRPYPRPEPSLRPEDAPRAPKRRPTIPPELPAELPPDPTAVDFDFDPEALPEEALQALPRVDILDLANIPAGAETILDEDGVPHLHDPNAASVESFSLLGDDAIEDFEELEDDEIGDATIDSTPMLAERVPEPPAPAPRPPVAPAPVAEAPTPRTRPTPHTPPPASARPRVAHGAGGVPRLDGRHHAAGPAPLVPVALPSPARAPGRPEGRAGGGTHGRSTGGAGPHARARAGGASADPGGAGERR